MKNVLKHADDVNIAINEYISRHSVNRNLQKLLENDVALNDLYISIFGGLDIAEYIDGRTYDFGKIVWFRDRTSKLWLLQCVRNDNSQSPQSAVDDQNEYQQPNFEKYGWEDLNEHVDIMNMGLDTQIQRLVSNSISEHEDNEEMHKFGELNAASLPKKVLKRDLSNISQDRGAYFFPYKTGHFTTDSIIDGTYRVWDCGVIEFNIVFRMGYRYTDELGYDVLSCNDFQFKTSSARTVDSVDYQENSKYFYSPNDMKIFKNPDTVEVFSSTIGSLKQKNRNNYVNSYMAKLEFFPQDIEFPVSTNGTVVNKLIDSFKDLNYMVFIGDMLCQDPDSSYKTIYPSQNSMTWCDKTRKSISAILVTFPRDSEIGSFGEKGGLAANSFSCHVIGRWK